MPDLLVAIELVDTRIQGQPLFYLGLTTKQMIKDSLGLQDQKLAPARAAS